MPKTLCPNCNAVVGEDAPRCPRCGLAFAPGRIVSPVPLSSTPPPPRVPSLSSPPPGFARASAPGTDPYLNTVVAGRFRIEELIGAGGMGKVYRATHLGLDKVVCLKTLKPSLLEDATIVGRFEREAKAASRLDHPNSIQVLDFGQDERGNLFLVMEYVAGRDLRKLMRDEFPVGEQRLARIVGQVLGALSRAHAMGVIHRDLKPENILVARREDEPDFVKVLDFGIAKLQDPGTPGLTRHDMVCGTPEYMSPEQAQGKDIDARADLYAVGVILYQCVTGQLPFDGRQAMEILQKQVYDAPKPPRTVTPGSCSEALERLILQALSKNPAERPQTADEFRRELLAAVGLTTGTPPPRPKVTRDGRSVKDHDAPLSEEEVEKAIPKSRAPMILGVLALVAALAAGGWYFRRAAPAGDDNDNDLVQETDKPDLPGGGLTKNAAYDIIESHYDQVRHCFERAKRRIDEAEGELVLSIAIGDKGTVTTANIPQSTIEEPKLEKCLLDHAKLWTFPRPQRAPMLLSYTYKFRKH